jgi:hypothetical protein
MSRLTRPLVRLLVGLFAVLPATIGSVAFAATEPVGGNSPDGTLPYTSGGVSFAQQVAWMATGAVIVLLVAAAVAGIAVLSRRHQIQTRQLQMP